MAVETMKNKGRLGMPNESKNLVLAHGKRGLGNIGDVLVVVMLGMAIIIGGGMWIGNFYSHASVGASGDAYTQTQASQAYSKLNGSVNTIANSLQQSSTTSDNPFSVLFNNAFEAVKQIFNMLDGLITLVSGIGAFLIVIPGFSWFAVIIGGIVATFIGIRALEIALGRQF